MQLCIIIAVFLVIALAESQQKSILNPQPIDFSNLDGKQNSFLQWDETNHEESRLVFNNADGKETELIVKAMVEEKIIGDTAGFDSKKRQRRAPQVPEMPKDMPTPPSMPEGVPSPPTPPEGMATPPSMPEGVPSPPSSPEGVTPPEGMTKPEGMTPPEGMAPPKGMTPPEGMTPPSFG